MAGNQFNGFFFGALCLAIFKAFPFAEFGERARAPTPCTQVPVVQIELEDSSQDVQNSQGSDLVFAEDLSQPANTQELSLDMGS
eukprot:2082302-Pyramimonas_sp.AAC.4